MISYNISGDGFLTTHALLKMNDYGDEQIENYLEWQANDRFWDGQGMTMRARQWADDNDLSWRDIEINVTQGTEVIREG